MSTIWVNKPKKLYIIETNQGRFRIEAEWLDYKKTVGQLKRDGHTNIHINCIGYSIHHTY